MSRLSDLVAEAVAEVDDGRARDPSAAAALVVERVGDEEKVVLLFEAALLRCKKAAAARGPAESRSAATSGQLSLFPEPLGAYAVDLDSNIMVQTGRLTRAEFQRIIAIREQQIVNDSSRLRDLRRAYNSVTPFWDAHPDWTFAQCCAALVERERGAS